MRTYKTCVLASSTYNVRRPAPMSASSWTARWPVVSERQRGGKWWGIRGQNRTHMRFWGKRKIIPWEAYSIMLFSTFGTHWIWINRWNSWIEKDHKFGESHLLLATVAIGEATAVSPHLQQLPLSSFPLPSPSPLLETEARRLLSYLACLHCRGLRCQGPLCSPPPPTFFLSLFRCRQCSSCPPLSPFLLSLLVSSITRVMIVTQKISNQGSHPPPCPSSQCSHCPYGGDSSTHPLSRSLPLPPCGGVQIYLLVGIGSVPRYNFCQHR